MRPEVLLFTAACGAALLMILGGSMMSEAISAPKPDPGHNVVVVQVDSMRADRLGVYGYDRNTSPSIDRLAADGSVFEAATTRALWQLTGQVSLFTSLYAHQLGMRGVSPSMARNYELATEQPNTTTLFEAFDQYGYDTAAIVGTWPGGWPQFREERTYQQGVDQYYAPGPMLGQTVPTALRWLDQEHREPFLLYVSSHELHTPLEFPAPYEHMFADPSYDGPIDSYNLSYIPSKFGNYRLPFLPEEASGTPVLDDITRRDGRTIIDRENGTIPLDDTDIEHIRDHYDGGQRLTDEHLGRLMQGLQERGLYEDTIIVVTADNGQNLADHVDPRGNLFSLYQVYDHTIRIPLIINAPEMDHRRIPQQAELVDVMPTLLELAGIPVSEEVQEQMVGDSLVPLMEGEDVQPNPYVFSLGAWSSQSVRTQDWKFIERDAANWSDELYDLRTDPGETENLIEEHPQIAERLRQQLHDWDQYFPRRNKDAVGKRGSGH